MLSDTMTGGSTLPWTDDILARWIRQFGTITRAPRRTTIFGQGDPSRGIAYIEDGWIVLTRTEGTGLDVIVGVRQPGAILGVAATVSALPHPVAAVARSQVVLRTVPVPLLERALREDAAIRAALIAEVGREALAYAAHCGTLGCLDARERLQRLLFELAASSTITPARICLRTSELAGLIGVDASHVRRLLRALRRDRLIETAGHALIVRHPDRLLDGHLTAETYSMR